VRRKEKNDKGEDATEKEKKNSPLNEVNVVKKISRGKKYD